MGDSFPGTANAVGFLWLPAPDPGLSTARSLISDDISRNGCEAAVFVSRTINEVEKTLVGHFEPERPGPPQAVARNRDCRAELAGGQRH